MHQIFALMLDDSGTMTSSQQPTGVAVKSEKEAKRYVAKATQWSSRGYVPISVCDTLEEAMEEEERQLANKCNKFLRR